MTDGGKNSIQEPKYLTSTNLNSPYRIYIDIMHTKSQTNGMWDHLLVHKPHSGTNSLMSLNLANKQDQLVKMIWLRSSFRSIPSVTTFLMNCSTCDGV